MIKRIIGVMIGIAIALSAQPAAFAAAAGFTAYFSASTGTVSTGSTFAVKILIDAAEPVNAYSLAVNYSVGTLDLVSTDNSRSLLDVWQTPPVTSGGGVTFKGGSTAPFEGSGGELLTLLFHVKDLGDATVSFGDISLYLANGKGTKVIPDAKSLTIPIAPGTGAASSTAPSDLYPNDKTPPEAPEVSIVPDPYNSSQKFLEFRALDPDSGVKEVLVRTRQWIGWSAFAPAMNPTALAPGVWSAEIEVIDNAGNIKTVTVYDWKAFATGPLAIMGLIVIGIVILKFLI